MIQYGIYFNKVFIIIKMNTFQNKNIKYSSDKFYRPVYKHVTGRYDSEYPLVDVSLDSDSSDSKIKKTLKIMRDKLSSNISNPSTIKCCCIIS